MPPQNDPLEFLFALLRPYLTALNVGGITAEQLAATGEFPSLEQILSGEPPPGPEGIMLNRIRALPQLVNAIRQFRRTLGPTPKIPNVPPEQLEQAILRTDVEKILRGPFFHGGSPKAIQQILTRGFDPERLGRTFGFRFGEPAGVSLTASPRVAQEFSGLARHSPSILRVQPEIRPEQVLSPFLPKGANPLLESYLAALRRSQVGRDELLRDVRRMAGFAREPSGSGSLSVPQALQEAQEAMILGGRTEFTDPTRFFDYLKGFPSIIRPFNIEVSKQLQRQGFEGILQSPRRMSEFELRVLDPRRAIPLELRKDLPRRFTKPKQEVLEEFSVLTPETPASLADIYRQVNLESILGTR